MAAALVDRGGRVLLSTRPPGKHLAGLWEFPGGKLEPGEARRAGLERELREEIGVCPLETRPLIRVDHEYPDRTVHLDVWRVAAWRGTPAAREGQRLEWVAVDDLPARPMPPADRPVVGALRLPERYLVTPDPGRDPDAFLARLALCLAGGVRLVQLRAPSLRGTPLVELAHRAALLCREHGARLLVNGDPQTALAAGAGGVHLSSARLLALPARPLSRDLLVGASCHDAAELAQAVRVEADFAVLGPVRPTPTHPGAATLGWEGFRALASAEPLPVYALGGVAEPDLPAAWEAGAQGIAAIRGLWDPSGPLP